MVGVNNIIIIRKALSVQIKMLAVTNYDMLFLTTNSLISFVNLNHENIRHHISPIFMFKNIFFSKSQLSTEGNKFKVVWYHTHFLTLLNYVGTYNVKNDKRSVHTTHNDIILCTFFFGDMG